MKKVINVVGAVIVEDGKILCVKRGPSKSLPLLWEFPGGKIEVGEDPCEALKREIKEEMLCKIEVGDMVEQTLYNYDFGEVNLTTYLCKLVEGEPKLTEHVDLLWLYPKELTKLDWAPADIPAVEKLLNYKF